MNYSPTATKNKAESPQRKTEKEIEDDLRNKYDDATDMDNLGKQAGLARELYQKMKEFDEDKKR